MEDIPCISVLPIWSKDLIQSQSKSQQVNFDIDKLILKFYAKAKDPEKMKQY